METTSAFHESCRHEQNREFEVIRSVFGDNVEDLRDRNDDVWKPLDIRILMKPYRRYSNDGETSVVTKVHIACPVDYPKVAPKISLEETKGISKHLIDELLTALQHQSIEMLGKATIRKLLRTVQAFLDKQDEQIMEQKEPIKQIHQQPLYFKSGMQIKLGSRLGYSEKGCIAYVGFDMINYELVYITEWNIKYDRIEQCTDSCVWSNVQIKCHGHKIDDICNALEMQVERLSCLFDRRLIKYRCVLCTKHELGLQVFLVQDFVQGTCASSISKSIGWSVNSARMVTKDVLYTLHYLHSNGIPYMCLSESTVFWDNSGSVRYKDYGEIMVYLSYLVGVKKHSNRDLPALGALVASFMPTPTLDMKHFINKCNSVRTLSVSELFDHSFLTSDSQSSAEENSIPLPTEKEESAASPAAFPATSELDVDLSSGPDFSVSRLKKEFDEFQYLGRGAFGDVLKARNILDNREYAIKQITLPSKSRQLYHRMTREVELLSRLRHENIVRYFNSWIESITDEEMKEMEKFVSGGSSRSYESSKSSSASGAEIKETSDDSENGGIEFVNSDSNLCEKCPLIDIMYIQMEFCEKSTLRSAIDDYLHVDLDRLWRLFREILEGLCYIHKQGIIHRDLKPVNIFLDTKDQIKIGDFGLATTSFLALRTQGPTFVMGSEVGSGTKEVGTSLYVAPELLGNASESRYGQKVDMYSLGIILFEMSQPPFETEMERIWTINQLRTPAVIIPESMKQQHKYSKIIELICGLLKHDPGTRPTASMLLKSDVIPPAQLKQNPSRDFSEIGFPIFTPNFFFMRKLDRLKYPFDTLNPSNEFVKLKVVDLFRKHGAVEVDTPLLSPHFNSNRQRACFGLDVVLPRDLRRPFAREIAMSGVNMLRRYSVDRVYREEKQCLEAAFDIITPMPGSHLIDAEILTMAHEITRDISFLREHFYIRMNHSNLLRSILLHCNVQKANYVHLFNKTLGCIKGSLHQDEFKSVVTAIMEKSETSNSVLIDMLLTEFTVDEQRNIADEPALKSLVCGKGEVSSLAKGAIEELQAIVHLAKSLGVTCPIHVCAGLPINFERASIVWEMVVNLESERTLIVATGERYDAMLMEFYKQEHCVSSKAVNHPISGTGLSFFLDNLAEAVGPEYIKECHTIDAGICVIGSRPPLKDITSIICDLWSAGIRIGIVEATNADEGRRFSEKLDSILMILVEEDGSLYVRLRDSISIQEQHVSRSELIEYVQKLLRDGIDIPVLDSKKN